MTVQTSPESETTTAPVIDQKLVVVLVARASAKGVSLTGEVAAAASTHPYALSASGRPGSTG